MSDENITEAEFEEVVHPVTAEVHQLNIDELPDQYEDEAQEESGESFVPESYDAVKIDRSDAFLDEHGNTIDPSTLTIFDRLKLSAKQIGQEVNDPDPKCKKCYGRGYVGININGNIPLPCNCIYKKFFKNNPNWRNQQMPSWNRKAKRTYEKRMSKFINLQAAAIRQKHANEEKSRANLGKNTPKVDPIVTTESSTVSA